MEAEGITSGRVEKLLEEGRTFFRRIRLAHGALAVIMLATGSAATALSHGSNGTSKIPYYFSAYISGFWNIVLLVLCQVSIYYLSGDTNRVQKAGFWVTGYSIACSMLVIFNVMGMIFVVVNGLCIHNQQCYYDRNIGANRALAISLILQNVICDLICILFAKRAHNIDRDIGSDITIKLGHYMNIFRQRVRNRLRSAGGASAFRSNSSISTLGSCSSLHKPGANDAGHRESSKVDREKVIAHVMAQREQQKHRSKSHPNLHGHQNHEIPVEHLETEGKIVSIYSDSETTISIDSNKKKRYTKQKHNVIKPASIVSEHNSKTYPESSPISEVGQSPMGLTGRSEDSGVSVDDDKWSSSSTSTFRTRLERRNSNLASGQTSDIASDITETDSVVGRYKKQLELQQHREELRQAALDKRKALLEQQGFITDSPPPPYEEVPPLPNMVLNVKPAQQEQADDDPKNQN